VTSTHSSYIHRAGRCNCSRAMRMPYQDCRAEGCSHGPEEPAGGCSHGPEGTAQGCIQGVQRHQVKRHCGSSRGVKWELSLAEGCAGLRDGGKCIAVWRVKQDRWVMAWWHTAMSGIITPCCLAVIRRPGHLWSHACAVMMQANRILGHAGMHAHCTHVGRVTQCQTGGLQHCPWLPWRCVSGVHRGPSRHTTSRTRQPGGSREASSND
jgi:hypothetical protein